MHYFYGGTKQKLSQNVIIPELGVRMIPIVESPLNVKKVVTNILYLIKHMLMLIFKSFKKVF